ncbi:MAG: hypothetical protein LBI80_04475 [Endomicrobium sp.]|jgi:hypothetical protein|nr:hypothetical protein [Endomicrobium sp.]
MFKEHLITIGGNEYPYYFSDDTQLLADKLMQSIMVDKFFIIYDSNVPIEKIDNIKTQLNKQATTITVLV